MIYDRWNHSKAPPKKPLPLLSYNIIRPDQNFFTLSPKSTPSKINTQRNGITCMQLTSPKVPLSKTIHDQFRPLPRSSSCAVIYAFSSKQAHDGYSVIFRPSPLKCQQNLDRSHLTLVYFLFTALSQGAEVMHIY